MKNLITLVVLTLVGLTTSAENKSNVSTYNYGYGSSIIFVERNVEFAIYPDGNPVMFLLKLLMKMVSWLVFAKRLISQAVKLRMMTRRRRMRRVF